MQRKHAVDEQLMCLLACLHSKEDEKEFFELMDAVNQIYQAGKEGRAAANDDADVRSESQSSDPTRSAKKSKTSSASTDRALEVFQASMMAAQPPQHKNVPTSAEGFLAEMMLSDEQRGAIMAQLPAAAAGPTLSMLSAFDDGLLVTCGLSGLQRSAWRKLSDKLF